jgi:hypothetical protein
VQKSIPVATAKPEDDMAAVTCAALAEPAQETAADTPGQLVDKKSAENFQSKLDEGIVEHGLRTMALTVQTEKTGKSGRCPTQNRIQLFPSWRRHGHLLC